MKRLVILLLVFLLASHPLYAFASPTQTINEQTTVSYTMKERTPLKATRHTKGKTVIHVPANKGVRILSPHGSWTKIRYGQKQGFVPTKQLKRHAQTTVLRQTNSQIDEYVTQLGHPEDATAQFVSKHVKGNVTLYRFTRLHHNRTTGGLRFLSSSTELTVDIQHAVDFNGPLEKEVDLRNHFIDVISGTLYGEGTNEAAQLKQALLRLAAYNEQHYFQSMVSGKWGPVHEESTLQIGRDTYKVMSYHSYFSLVHHQD